MSDSGQNVPTTASVDLKRFMMIYQPDRTNWRNKKTLQVSAMAPSKTGFIIFNNMDGADDFTNYSFHTQHLRELLGELISHKGTEEYQVEATASREAIAEKPDRPTTGSISLNKTEKGCYVTLSAHGKKSHSIPFAAIPGTAVIFGGTEVKPDFESAMITWFSNLLDASDRVADAVYSRYSREWRMPDRGTQRVNTTTGTSTPTDDDIPF